MMNSRCCLTAHISIFAATAMLAGPVLAATDSQQTEPSEWSVGLGVGGGWSPEYLGADTYKAEGLPWIQARKGQLSINPVTGISYDFLKSERWKLGPALSYARGRENSGALTQFEDVHGSLLAGAIASWTSGQWQINGDIAAPVSGDLDGVRVRGYLRFCGKITNRLLYAAGPGVSWASNRWSRALFDVSIEDAARSGLRPYRAEGEYVQGSMNGRLTFLVTRKFSVSTVAQYSRLFGDAADSSIVEDVGDANQWHGSLAINYQF
ncbi:MltA-interacting MipA [Marinobacter sp. AC-23]|nr:MltA-interacting MipA [Marinobacter sp. AC-23]